MKLHRNIYLIGALFFSFTILTLLFNITYQLFQMRKINIKKYSLINEIEKLEKDSKFYIKENKKLDTLDGLEEYARKKLGMIKKGEKLYRIVGARDGKKSKE